MADKSFRIWNQDENEFVQVLLTDLGVTDPDTGKELYGVAAALTKGAVAPSTSANAPSILTSAGDDHPAANASRKLWAIQNLGQNPLYVRLGAGASATVFHIALKGGAANDDGQGGYISDDVWKGAVSVAGTSPRYVVTELT